MNLAMIQPYEQLNTTFGDTIEAAISMPDFSNRQTQLPASFKPHPYTVVIGRGKERVMAVVGNRRLRILVEMQLENYIQAKSRQHKSIIVASILDSVQHACRPEGAFVRFDGRYWWELEDSTAREKIGSVFRDRLVGSHYKSSTKAKMAKRRAKRAQKRLTCSIPAH
jgi:hypothetical protein